MLFGEVTFGVRVYGFGGTIPIASTTDHLAHYARKRS